MLAFLQRRPDFPKNHDDTVQPWLSCPNADLRSKRPCPFDARCPAQATHTTAISFQASDPPSKSTNTFQPICAHLQMPILNICVPTSLNSHNQKLHCGQNFQQISR